jgi:predicted small secreted protein
VKKLLYLGFVLMLASCENTVEGFKEDFENTTKGIEKDFEKLEEEFQEKKRLEEEKRIEERSTIKIGDLEVMTEDLGEMNWDDAKKACADLGDGWRLPTKDELNVLYETRDKIGGSYDGYWSSTEFNGYGDNDDYHWFSYSDGEQYFSIKDAPLFVRAVRSI